MIQMLKGAATWTGSALLDLFYPPQCYHCEAPLVGEGLRLLCPSCLRALVRARIRGPLCPVCGRPYADDPLQSSPCLGCQTRRPHFDVARSVFAYAGPAASIVKGFKFDGQFFLGGLLMRLALERGWLGAELRGFDCAVPVPLHPRRERERGYNQAALLAQVVARCAGVPLLQRVLMRRRYTSQQTRLPSDARWENVRGAFSARRRVDGAHMLVVDDVMTTGATASECARMLKQAGAARVSVLTLTRTQA